MHLEMNENLEEGGGGGGLIEYHSNYVHLYISKVCIFKGVTIFNGVLF